MVSVEKQGIGMSKDLAAADLILRWHTESQALEWGGVGLNKSMEVEKQMECTTRTIICRLSHKLLPLSKEDALATGSILDNSIMGLIPQGIAP